MMFLFKSQWRLNEKSQTISNPDLHTRDSYLQSGNGLQP